MKKLTITPRLHPTVIYVMECAGYHYGGKHEVGPRHDISGWPAEGGGALPDRYRGSGKAWLNIVRKHGLYAVKWKIITRFTAPTLADVDRAEREVIAGLREVNGEKCVNLREGAVMTSADAKKMYERPEHRANVKAANRRLAQDPEWREKNAEANQKIWATPGFREKKAGAIRRPEVRAKLAESQGSIPAAPPETLFALRSFFLSAPKSWSKRELLARAALRVTGVPAWQFAQVCNEAGIDVSPDNTHANVLRYIQALLPTIIVAEDQSAEAFVVRVLELKASGLSNARAEWQAALEMPNVSRGEASSVAREVGHVRGDMEREIGLARTLAAIIREETALLRAA